MAKDENNNIDDFLKTAESLGGDVDLLRNFLYLLNARQSLKHLIKVCMNLNECLSISEDLFAITDFLDEYPIISKSIAFILKHKNEFIESNSIFDIPRANDIDPNAITHIMHNYGLTNQPMYAALLNDHETEKQDFRLMQLHTLIASIKLLKEYCPDRSTYFNDNQLQENATSIIHPYTSYITDACLCLRKFSDEPFVDAVLNLGANPVDAPNAFYETILEFNEEEKIFDKFNFVKSYKIIFNLVYRGIEKNGKSSGGGKRKYKSKHFYGGYINVGEGKTQETISLHDDPDAAKITNFYQHKNKQSINEWLIADLDPDENVDDNITQFVDTGCNTHSILPDVVSAKNLSGHLQLFNQLLPSRRSVLSNKELDILVSNCLEHIKDPMGDVNRKEAILFILISLLTGRTIDIVANTQWIPNIGHIKQTSNEIVFCEAENLLIVRPEVVETNIRISEDKKNYLRKTSKFLFLHDYFNLNGYISDIFKTYISNFKNELALNPKQTRALSLFKLRPRRTLKSTYKNLINEFLSLLPIKHRININKIESFLFNAIINGASDDVADAVMITGKYHSNAKTLLHYYTPLSKSLQNIYDTTMIQQFPDHVYFYDVINCSDKLSKLNIHSIGNNFCPTTNSLRRMVLTLKSKIKIPDKNNLKENIINYHNNYTFYCLQFNLYATGYRAVKDPFINIPEIIDNMAIISDKDGDDNYNSRIVYVPDNLIKQINFYKSHRQIILSELFNHDTNIQSHTDFEQIPFFFFLSKHFHPLQIKPSIVNEIFGDVFPLPLNANRKYLRTELKEAGCQTAYVNAFMGHWVNGTEPWNPFSCDCTYDFINTLKGYIDTLLFNNGWQPLKSKII